MVYIVQVLVEHPTHALDTTFDYLANTEIASGVRGQLRLDINE